MWSDWLKIRSGCGILTHCSRETHKRVVGKQCRPRWDAAERGIWSGAPLFADSLAIFLQEHVNLIASVPKIATGLFQYIVWESLFSIQWINLFNMTMVKFQKLQMTEKTHNQVKLFYSRILLKKDEEYDWLNHIILPVCMWFLVIMPKTFNSGLFYCIYCKHFDIHVLQLYCFYLSEIFLSPLNMLNYHLKCPKCWVNGKQCTPWSEPHFAMSNLGLHCLLRPVYLTTKGKYSTDSCVSYLLLLDVHVDYQVHVHSESLKTPSLHVNFSITVRPLRPLNLTLYITTASFIFLVICDHWANFGITFSFRRL